MEKELLLSVHDLKKSFGEREILKGISFDVRRGDVVCIIGPSGSGKVYAHPLRELFGASDCRHH